jgi:ABC-type transport system involved in multi-copper enzyme maturation permease subunit
MFFRIGDPDGRWPLVVELSFRSLVLLAPVLHLAPAIGEEQDGKTYTYLWSRPIRREAILLGKLLAIAPAAALAAVVVLLAEFGIVALGPATPDVGSLPRVLLAAVAGVAAASAYALGVGSLFPRHPLVAAMAYVFFAEQILPQVKAIQNLSTLYHVKRIAAVADPSFVGEAGVPEGLAGLAILSAIWLAIAIWRVRRVELGSAEG